MKLFGKTLDSKIRQLKMEPRMNAELLFQVCELHYELTNLFKEITGKYNRSLASKYLHFHLPNLFYIYDKRASDEINKLKLPLKI
jgi:hypothetical protein